VKCIIKKESKKGEPGENMNEEKKELVRNKATICATVSPWLKRQVEKAVEKGDDFASVSDFVSLACQEFLVRHFPEKLEKQKK
jgi:hypothetical protein